jgi:hypothetical protein
MVLRMYLFRFYSMFSLAKVGGRSMYRENLGESLNDRLERLQAITECTSGRLHGFPLRTTEMMKNQYQTVSMCFV